jgi:alanyl-tRNA synthetase
MSSVNDIRSKFLSYFAANGHEIVESSPLVPRNDPTLMFTTAGMVQFKNIFTGAEKRSYNRAVTAQKCVRAGGKHNDLDNVGYTARHHTFFEMLGNFSFGDYFKPLAIELAWNLITKEYGLPKDKLLVTVYHDDDDAFNLWKKIAGLSDDKIIRIPTSDNYWRMGDTGPCGPCSEIFYDHGDKIWGGPPGSADENGDRFIEIWNLVFMQFEETAAGKLALPKPSIDTGMGLERISAVMQGTHDNYQTDMMKALIESVCQNTGVGEISPSHKVIADHLRAASFLVADGVLPSNEGRGYVLRRIMRRAMRHAQLLGSRDPLMHKLVPSLVKQMGQAYPELVRGENLITETLLLEENRFRKTLERGLILLDEQSKTLSNGATFSGETAFTLYDTYGFPLDLTQDALRARDISVDTEAFNAAMQAQKAKARASWAGTGDAESEAVYFGIKERVGASEFLGYETESAEGQIVSLIQNGVEVQELTGKGFVILNQTPFYAESGGQTGDTGVMSGEGFTLKVLDTQKKTSDLFVHEVEVTGVVQTNASAILTVDHATRQGIRAHHSATHILHEALRLTLGDHIAQKGSSVTDDRLRFDFSHNKAISQEELTAIENLSNAVVLGNTPVTTRLMSVDDAKNSGARALFGEKYGETVRVVGMGAVTGNKAWSVELCGGTHVKNTGEIGLVTIVSESGVAAGVRRLEALTGNAARLYLNEQNRKLNDIAASLKASPADALTRINALSDDKKRLEKELTEVKKKLATGGEDKSELINGTVFIGKILSGVAAKDLKGIADDMRKSNPEGVIALIAIDDENKAALVISDTRGKAVAMVQAGAAILGGKGGGGRPDMAQAGGPEGDKAQSALDVIKGMV